MSDLIVRCSAIGRLMAKPENADLDPEHLTPEVQAIIAKTKRSDEEKSVLEDVRRKSLSAGGKTAWLRLDPATGNAMPAFDQKALAAAMNAVADISRLELKD